MHPDKNPEDKVRATKEFQLLTEAKIVLLDAEKRRNLDESLIDNGVRNWNALSPVQTSCFCRAELNSGIKFDKSTAEARRLNQTFELSSASN